jgi:hypothetical protein
METRDFKILTQDNIPCWYELSWREKRPAVVLKVHKDFIKESKAVSDDAPIVNQLKEEFGFKDFIGNFDGDFGFDKAFIRDKETEEFVEFLIKIPRVKRETGKNCEYCNGSGWDKRLDNKCIHCNGKGKEYIYDYQSAYAISASFHVFFVLTYHPEKETSSALFQLLTVTVSTTRDWHGGSLSGMYSVPLCDWLDSLREKRTANIAAIPEMIKAMQSAYRAMLGLTEYEEHYFRASVDYEGGWLNVSCPGDACGLNPVHMGPKKGKGYDFSCHNVDTPVQQITLLAGLAALHDKARKELQV